ncbi:Ger(x)C family spore germination protein [Bacillus sp. BRMEA1]|uniref:Ger(x)C family spore germination protein n=1 Tax=Neobacillus endophyticus TaxID=2738405 RepID=UPI001567246E|nr:Ger(x)C family spore germination protein [Neobacillus endophyticus]NRD78293.1 Ger(x)C family spore germination protein [Neobacillus endophyticus]
MLRNSNITLFLVIGLIISLIVGKKVQDTLLNKISVVSAIGIDKSKSGYIASVQIYNPAANTKEGSAELGAYAYSAKGRTIPEAIDGIHKNLARTIFLESTVVAVIGESFVKSEGISSVTNYFLRDSRLPANIRFVISKGINADKLLQIFTPVQKISGSRLEEMLSRKRESWGNLTDITSDEIKGMLNQNRTELTIPYITIKGDSSKGISKSNVEKATPDALIEIGGIAVFKHQKFSYWLSSQEGNLLALTKTKIQGTTLVTKCENRSGYVTWKDVESKPVIRVQDKKGVPSFVLQLQMKGKLYDVSCNKDTSTVQAISSLEHDAEQELQKQIQQMIIKTQNNQTDIEGFGEALYRKQPAAWNKIKNNWESAYSKVPIQTKVKVDLLDVGEISSSLK